MDKALYRGIPVTPEEHERLAGKNWIEKNAWPECEICETRVHPNFVHSLNAPSRFDHVDGVVDCPQSARADPRFQALRPTAIDHTQSARLKAVFQQVYRDRAYFFCAYHVGRGFSEQTFDKLISRADRLKIWSYQNLMLWCVPYILLTLEDFSIPMPDTGRTIDIQFNFKKPARGTIDDIWVRPQDCSLRKIFRSTGGLAKYPIGNPYPLSETYFWIAGNPKLKHLASFIES